MLEGLISLCATYDFWRCANTSIIEVIKARTSS